MRAGYGNTRKGKGKAVMMTGWAGYRKINRKDVKGRKGTRGKDSAGQEKWKGKGQGKVGQGKAKRGQERGKSGKGGKRGG